LDHIRWSLFTVTTLNCRKMLRIGVITQCTHIRRNGTHFIKIHRVGTSEVFRSRVFWLLSKGSPKALLYSHGNAITAGQGNGVTSYRLAGSYGISYYLLVVVDRQDGREELLRVDFGNGMANDALYCLMAWRRMTFDWHK